MGHAHGQSSKQIICLKSGSVSEVMNDTVNGAPVTQHALTVSLITEAVAMLIATLAMIIFRKYLVVFTSCFFSVSY